VASKKSSFGFGKMLSKLSKSLLKSSTESLTSAPKKNLAMQAKPEITAKEPELVKGNLVVDCEGEFSLEIAGTQHYQKQLTELVGSQNIPPSGLFALCQLVREPSNEFDSNAVKVTIVSKKVGYLPRGDAEEFQETLRENGIGRAKIFTHARILTEEDGSLKVEIDWDDTFEVSQLEAYDRDVFLPIVLEDSENEEPVWLNAETNAAKPLKQKSI
jgi:HIRAN domain